MASSAWIDNVAALQLPSFACTHMLSHACTREANCRYKALSSYLNGGDQLSNLHIRIQSCFLQSKSCSYTMAFSNLPICFLVTLAFAASLVSSYDVDPQEYWHSVLPNTPIPTVLQQLLPTQGKSTSANVMAKLNGADIADDQGSLIFDEDYFNMTSSPLPDTTLFFQHNKLTSGTKMTMFSTNGGNKVNFLSRDEAESIPFESSKLQQILQLLSITPSSQEADVIKSTLSRCERPNLPGEDKACATSLESLIDFARLRLGRKDVRVIATPYAKKQEYTVISNGSKKLGDRVVACHKEKYAYAVYYCHEVYGTEVRMIPMVGADGTRLDAVANCHYQTASVSPQFFGFQSLGIKPGQPICHFLNADGVLWYRSN